MDIKITSANLQNHAANKGFFKEISEYKKMIWEIAEILDYKEKENYDGRKKYFSGTMQRIRFCSKYLDKSEIRGLKKEYASYKNEVLKQNLPLVIKYASKFSHNGNLSDLIQEGSIGLLNAFEKYDSKKGSFSTYASYWIKQQIIGAIHDKYHNDVRKPRDIGVIISKIKRRCGNIELLTLNEVMEYGGVSRNTAKRVLDALITSYIPSLDEAINNDESSFLSDIVGKEDKEIPDNKLRAILDDYISKLDLKEQEIIRKRYGLRYTLDRVGKDMGITRERVRQIQAKAIRKLKILDQNNKNIIKV